MKKVAIMTINSTNLGNRLQNYALQQVIRSLGYEVDTVRRTADLEAKASNISSIKHWLKYFRGSRNGLYIQFDRKFIHFSKYYAAPNEAEAGLADAYDIFVAGSDQVWNPHYGHRVGNSDLLMFAGDKKKISYAASFGVDTIPEEQKDRYRAALDKLDRISVRETAGARIVRELTGKQAEVTLDPTLLLTSEQWEQVQRIPRCVPSKKYALVYSLGGLTEEQQRFIDNCRADRQLEILDLLKKGPDGKLPPVGPSEFLYLVKHAEIVITNSFHALVFSSVFHTPVKVFPRAGIDMSSRIVTFAQTVGLTENYSVEGIFSVSKPEEFACIDEHLGMEREKSLRFLAEALGNQTTEAHTRV